MKIADAVRWPAGIGAKTKETGTVPASSDAEIEVLVPTAASARPRYALAQRSAALTDVPNVLLHNGQPNFNALADQLEAALRTRGQFSTVGRVQKPRYSSPASEDELAAVRLSAPVALVGLAR
jgi:hypothetical protein